MHIEATDFATADLERLDTLLRERHSVRGFLPEPVDHEVIEQMLAVASRSASWCNVQPWEVIVTEGQGTEDFREALRSKVGTADLEPDFPFPARYTGVFHERRLETALRLYDAVGVPRGDRAASGRQTARNFELFGAPHVAIITTEADLGVYGAVDCGIFVGNLLLAAQALGVGAIPQAALAAHSPVVREHFGLPDTRRVVCGVSFGWEDAEHPANAFRTSREATSALVTWAR